MAEFNESFNKADSVDLGADQPWTDVLSNLQNLENHCRTNTTATTGRSRMERDTDTSDQFAEAPIFANTPTSNSGRVGVCLRYDPVADTCYSYYVVVTTANGHSHTISKIVGGVETVIGGPVIQAFTNGDVLRFEVSGSSLVGKINGVAVPGLATTNGDIPTGTRSGAHIRAGTAATRIPTYLDSFKLGDLAAVTNATVEATADDTKANNATVATTAVAGAETPLAGAAAGNAASTVAQDAAPSAQTALTDASGQDSTTTRAADPQTETVLAEAAAGDTTVTSTAAAPAEETTAAATAADSAPVTATDAQTESSSGLCEAPDPSGATDTATDAEPATGAATAPDVTVLAESGTTDAHAEVAQVTVTAPHVGIIRRRRTPSVVTRAGKHRITTRAV